MADDTGFENELLDDSVEAGERSYTFCAGNETVESAADGTSHLWNQEGCGPATEAELEEYFNSANNLQETFGDFETYMEYMNRREDLIDSGEYDPGSWGDVVDTGGLSYQDPYGNYIDPDDYNNLSPNDFASKYGLDKSEVQVIEVDTTKSRQDGYNAWLESEAVQALNAEYGIDNTLRTEDGREYQWNGTGWVKVTEPDNMDFGRIMRVVTALAGAAVTGNALGPIIGGALGGAAGTAAGTGAVKGAISSILGQIIINGEVDPQALLQATLLGGLNSIAGAAIAGELAGTALDNALWDISGALGISYEEAANLLSGMANGAITGGDLEGIVLGAVGSWSQAQTMDFLQGTFGDEFNVQDWFKDGESTIPLEALEPIVDQIIGGVIDGSIDDPGAWLKTVWDYFQAGGDIDFMLPPGVDIGGLFELGNFDLSVCDEEQGETWWFCEMPDLTCPDFLRNEDGQCVGSIDLECPDSWRDENGECLNFDIDIPKPECLEGEEWDQILQMCVPISNICGDGLIWDDLIGDCVPDLGIDKPECLEGEEWDQILQMCVPIPNLCGDGLIWDDLIGDCVPDLDIDIDVPKPECLGNEEWDEILEMCVPKPQCLEGERWDKLLQKCVPMFDLDVDCPAGWDKDEDGVCIEPQQLCEEGYSWDILRGCIPDNEVEDPDSDWEDPDLDLDVDIDLPSLENNFTPFDVGPRAHQYAYDPFKPVEAQPVKEFAHLLNPLLDDGMFS